MDENIRKKKRGAVIAALVTITCTICWYLFLFMLLLYDNAPFGIWIFFLIMPIIPVTGILIALIQRIRELDKGEEEEAGIY